MSSNGREIVIIGGGLTGLTCALSLQKSGLNVKLLEATDRVGGRVKTDQVEGFRLDRGFQVFQDSYPTAGKWLDLKQLNLRGFRNGCLLRGDGGFTQIADPWRNPLLALTGLVSPPGNFADFWQMAKFRNRVLQEKEVYKWLEAPQTTSLERLRQSGFSESIIEDFFKPFLGGVFLEKDLETSSRMLDFVFSMFSRGSATLPADGMEAIPRQLAKQLSAGTIRTQTTVASLRDGDVILDDGTEVKADAVVIATEMPAAARLLQQNTSSNFRQTQCVYFDVANAPIEAPVLVLNRNNESVVSSLCCPNRVQPSYSPEGRTLVSVTSVGPLNCSAESHLKAVRDELRGWFGSEVDRWRHLATYNIPYALPDQGLATMDPVAKSPKVRERLYQCGDYCDTRSIDGAMRSGERAAQAVLQDLKARG